MKYKNYSCWPTFSNAEKNYYGTVEGLPDIGDIEAASLEEFEANFHKAIDDYLRKQKKSTTRGKRATFISSIAVLGVILAMVISCPKKSQHIDALADMAVRACRTMHPTPPSKV